MRSPWQRLKRGLTKGAQCFIIQTKGKPRTRLLLQTAEYSWFTKSIRHLAEWRLLFSRSYTIIVMVYFPKWNVIRISFTSFRRCRSNRLRVCCSPFSPCGYLYCNAISAYCQSVTICIPLCEQNKTRTLTSAGFILFGVLTPRPRTPPPSRRRRWRRHPPFHPRWRTCSPATPPRSGPGRTGRSSRA